MRPQSFRTPFLVAPLLVAPLLAARSLTAQPLAPLPPAAPLAPLAPLAQDLPREQRLTVFRTRSDAPRSALGLVLGAADTLGLRVARVTADGPAAKGGIGAGDRVLAVNGTSLRVERGDAGDPLLAAVPARRLERAVARLAPGSEVELRVAGRDGRERTVRLRTVAPTALATEGFGPERDFVFRSFGPDVGPTVDIAMRGMSDSLRADIRRRATATADSVRARAAARPVLGLTLTPSNSPRDTLGLFVSSVVTGGPADRAGVVEGDRVVAINAVDLRVSRDEQGDDAAALARRSRFTRELERARPGDRVTLKVWGDGRVRTITATAARAADLYRDAGLRFDFGPAWGASGTGRSADR